MDFGSAWVYVPEPEPTPADEAEAAPPAPADDLISFEAKKDEAAPNLPSAALAPLAPEPQAQAQAPAPVQAAPLRAARAPGGMMRRRPAQPAANPNVVAIKLGSLEGAAQVLTGDPVFCSGCRAVYNAESHRAREAKQQGQVRPRSSAALLTHRCT